jgi:hypothetical protein
MNTKTFCTIITLPLLLLLSCRSPQVAPTSLPTPFSDSTLTPSEAETATLLSLEQVDDYPLYTMRYFGTYTGRAASNADGLTDLSQPTVVPAPTNCRAAWGCSLFAALGDEGNRLLGRNFDWNFSPALLLFTDPADGH